MFDKRFRMSEKQLINYEYSNENGLKEKKDTTN